MALFVGLGVLTAGFGPVALAALLGEPCVESTDCDDGDACTYERCGADRLCAAGDFVGCHEYTGCTYWYCEPSDGCHYPAIPGRCGLPGVESTFAFMAVTPAGGGPVEARRSTNDVLVNQFTGGEVYVSFYDAGSASGLTFHAPDDRLLVPGVYEGASASEERPPGTPALYGSLACPDFDYVSRFVVHEAVHEVHGWRHEVQGFVVDFTTRCSDGTEITGVIRHRAGDAGCRDAPDGTACDDRNACTARSECRGDVCAGDDAVQCATPTDGCHVTPTCNPMSGECLRPPELEDGTVCDDPARCITGGTCAAGTCTSDLVPCNDFDVCTRDVCEGDHRCTNPPIDGTCWTLKGTATFTATAFDASCSCEARAVPLPLALLDDGTFARSGGIAQCGAIVPEEVGIADRVARGRTKLRTTNLTDVRDICIASPSLRERRAWVKTNRARTRLRGLQVERIGIEDSPIELTTAIRFRGRPTSSGTSAGAIVSLGRCARQLIDCLNDKLEP